MGTDILSPELEKEEQVVAELERLGVRYLMRLSHITSRQNYPPVELIADITWQPSSRVRNALVSLFLAKPEYSAYIQQALRQVDQQQAILMKSFYTAAVLLQRKYANKCPDIILPDLFSKELLVSGITPDEQLCSLGKKHQEISGRNINWQGTYENAAKHLFRRWELEKEWSK